MIRLYEEFTRQGEKALQVTKEDLREYAAAPQVSEQGMPEGIKKLQEVSQKYEGIISKNDIRKLWYQHIYLIMSRRNQPMLESLEHIFGQLFESEEWSMLTETASALLNIEKRGMNVSTAIAAMPFTVNYEKLLSSYNVSTFVSPEELSTIQTMKSRQRVVRCVVVVILVVAACVVYIIWK